MKFNKSSVFFINYILSPLYVLIFFRILFFEDSESFTEKIMMHKYDLKMYLALLLSVLSLIFLRRGMKFPKDNKK